MSPYREDVRHRVRTSRKLQAPRPATSPSDEEDTYQERQAEDRGRDSGIASPGLVRGEAVEEGTYG